MAHLTVEEICQALAAEGVKTSERTIARQIAHLKQNDPKTYNRCVQQDGRKLVYKKDIILPYLRDFYSHKKVKPEQFSRAGAAKAAPVKKQTGARVPEPLIRKNYKPAEPEADEKLQQLLKEPLPLFTLDAELKKIFDSITQPAARARCELAISICSKYATGLDSLDYCCTAYGVPARTFWDWRCNIAEIAHLFKKCKARRRKNRAELVVAAAEDSLYQLVQGVRWEQVSTTYEDRLEPDGSVTSVPKGRASRNMFILPSLGAIVYALNNRAPTRWKNQQNLAVTPPPAASADDLTKLPDADLFEMVKAYVAQNPEAAQYLQNITQTDGNTSATVIG